jgi:zinc protease
MSTSTFKPEKKVLGNGLTVLIRPCHTIPRVEAHILYNVGSKDEDAGQKGIAHFIEHMLFKGTKNLSETDINLITHKLTGVANAFTAQDYTGYTLRLPSNYWDVALELFAECMQHARFDEQMIASEIKTVIEELRMYRDDYPNYLLESMMASMWPEHPYHNPVVGSPYDLCTLTKQHLVDFYHKYYHPSNATLVVVGNIIPSQVFDAAEKYFAHIKNPQISFKNQFFFRDDLITQSTTLYRHVNIPWCCYAYNIPGSQHGQHALYDIASLILGNGKSSRLYRRLVDKEQLAIDVDSSIMSFFEKGLFCISLYPSNIHNISTIEKIIEEEIEQLYTKPIAAWELQGATKKAQFDYTTLLESTEKQALLIGTSYLATHNENFLQDYFESINSLLEKDFQNFFKNYLNSRVLHKGYLLPLVQKDVEKYQTIQQQTEQLENSILKQHQRISPMEPGKFVNTMTYTKHHTFSYPKPEQFRLANGLEVIYYNNPNVPNIATILKFKANSLYDAPMREGCFLFLLRLLTDSTSKYTAEELNKLLESNGIFIGPQGDYLSCLCLSQDLEKALVIFTHILTNPSFKEQSIEKIRTHILNELTEYWDTPLDYIDQLTKELIYQQHPYSRPIEGSPKSIQNITKKDLQTCYHNYISPEAATLVVVGNITSYDIKNIITKHFNTWTGVTVPSFEFPLFIEQPAQCTHVTSPRDQVVLAFAASSVSRTDKNFHHLALLDIIFTGGPQGSTNSRLFELREKSGLFYAIGGSLVHGSREAPGIMFIKTLVSSDKVSLAQKLILDTLDKLVKNGITQEEFSMAKDFAISSSVELFENNVNIAQTFLFLKRFNLNFNLFDKQAEILSILNAKDLNKLVKQYCNRNRFSIITIGRKLKV